MAWHSNNWSNFFKIISYIATAIAGAISGNFIG